MENNYLVLNQLHYSQKKKLKYKVISITSKMVAEKKAVDKSKHQNTDILILIQLCVKSCNNQLKFLLIQALKPHLLK